jgi:hypothetical protein
MTQEQPPFYFKHNGLFQADAFTDDVHIIGCGGMGSHIAEGLIRMGVGIHSTIHLYDADRFERHNLANQAMTVEQVGQPKVEAVKKTLRRINPNCKIVTGQHEVRKCGRLDGVVFVCIDSMKDRMAIMEDIERNQAVRVVIETRMDANTGISFCFDPQSERHIASWWTYAYTDGEADNLTGCGGPVSIISAIFGTTMVALRQFESYARSGSAHGLNNRSYLDFDTLKSSTETWSSKPDWD